MDIKIAREVAARIWCDQEMSSIAMDAKLAEDVAQLLSSRLTPLAVDGSFRPGHTGDCQYPAGLCSCGYSTRRPATKA